MSAAGEADGQGSPALKFQAPRPTVVDIRQCKITVPSSTKTDDDARTYQIRVSTPVEQHTSYKTLEEIQDFDDMWRRTYPTIGKQIKRPGKTTGIKIIDSMFTKLRMKTNSESTVVKFRLQIEEYCCALIPIDCVRPLLLKFLGFKNYSYVKNTMQRQASYSILIEQRERKLRESLLVDTSMENSNLAGSGIAIKRIKKGDEEAKRFGNTDQANEAAKRMKELFMEKHKDLIVDVISSATANRRKQDLLLSPSVSSPGTEKRVSVLLSASRMERIAICTHDFAKESEQELGLKVGDRVRLIDTQNEDWWYGEKIMLDKYAEAEEGYFPPGFVELMKDCAQSPGTDNLEGFSLDGSGAVSAPSAKQERHRKNPSEPGIVDLKLRQSMVSSDPFGGDPPERERRSAVYISSDSVISPTESRASRENRHNSISFNSGAGSSGGAAFHRRASSNPTMVPRAPRARTTSDSAPPVIPEIPEMLSADSAASPPPLPKSSPPPLVTGMVGQSPQAKPPVPTSPVPSAVPSSTDAEPDEVRPTAASVRPPPPKPKPRAEWKPRGPPPPRPRAQRKPKTLSPKPPPAPKPPVQTKIPTTAKPKPPLPRKPRSPTQQKTWKPAPPPPRPTGRTAAASAQDAKKPSGHGASLSITVAPAQRPRSKSPPPRARTGSGTLGVARAPPRSKSPQPQRRSSRRASTKLMARLSAFEKNSGATAPAGNKGPATLSVGSGNGSLGPPRRPRRRSKSPGIAALQAKFAKS